MNPSELAQQNALLQARVEELERQLCECRQELDCAAEALQSECASRKQAEEEQQRQLERRQRTEEALRRSEHRYRSLFLQMSEGFALHEIIYDREGVPCDFRFLEVNPAFELFTGLHRSEIIGKTFFQVLPGSEPEWVRIYGEVATTGEPTHFERYNRELGRYHEVFAYSPASGQFATILLDVTARRRAEESLRESQNRLRLAIDSTELGAFDIEPQTRRFVGSEFARLHFGLSPDAQVNLEGLLSAIHPEDRVQVEKLVKRSSLPSDDGNLAAEFRTVSASGQVRWISAKGRIFLDSEGKPIRCIGVTLDITERKRMEQERRELTGELERQRSLFSAILNQIPAGILVADSANRVLFVSRGMGPITGDLDYEKGFGEFKRLNAANREGRSYEESDWPLSRSLAKGETIVDEEIQIRKSDGSVRFLLMSSAPVRDSAGQVVAGASVALDITERKQMEAALRASEERFRLASEAASEAIWEWDVQNDIIRCNNAFERLWEKPPEQFTIEWWIESIHPEDRERITSSLWTALDGHDPFWDGEYRLRTRMGWAEVYDRACIVRDSSGKPVRLIGAMLDLTLRNKAERRLNLLAETGSALLRTDQPQQLIDRLCRQVVAKLDCHVYFNYLLDEKESRLRLNAWGGILEEEARKIEWLDLGAAICGCAVRDGCRIIVEDICNSSDPRVELIRSYGIQAYACHPLVARGKCFGSLSFGTCSKIRFGEDELSLMLAVADQVAIAVERQRAHDSLEEKVVERTAELSRANRILRMMSACNRARAHASDEGHFIRTICRIVRDAGSYLMLWVGMAEQDDGKTVRPVASAGFEEGYLEKVNISWADVKHGQGPTGTAIRTGSVTICNDFLADPAVACWREAAVRHGFRSSIALPLICEGSPFGALTLYASAPSAFDQNHVASLQELAADLAFGIIALRAHRERDRALRNLETRTSQLRSLASALTRAEERERRRLAEVLHDGLQQMLVTAQVHLDIARQSERLKPFHAALKKVDAALNDCFETCRTLTMELSPRVLYEVGLAAALQWVGRYFSEKHDLCVKLKLDSQVTVSSEDVKIALFQAARELLFNVVKHAGVKTARLTLERLDNSQIRLVVSDKGKGFDPAHISEKAGLANGFGLFHMRERMEWIGGKLEIESAPGKGSRFTLLASDVVSSQTKAKPEPPSKSQARSRRSTAISQRKG